MKKMKSDQNTETRDLLIDTAGRLIANNGLQVTLRDIVASAGQSLGSIRYHFGNREGLLDAVAERASNGWRNNYTLINYILETGAELLKTPKGRREILRRAVDVFFHFINESDQRPGWAVGFMIRVLNPAYPSSCRKKFIERVAEPNRKSVNHLVLTLCPDLSPEEAEILNLNLFATPLFHYEMTYNPQKPVPFETKIPPSQFYIMVKESIVRNAWLVLEHVRKNG
ncbi:MAG: TetR family transcriptional regulator [Planctomycetia bacterium]|nr:TetR family transcriptional regulator [Planctomycetia bacterium]